LSAFLLREAMRRRFYFIENTIAGFGDQGLAGQVSTALLERGAAVVHGTSKDRSSALASARAAVLSGAFDALVASGGDGTIRLAAEASIGSGTPVGVIPLGTGNVLAHEVGLPRDAARLADLLVHGEVRNLQSARANGRLFLLMAGVGFDGAVVNALDHAWKTRLGKLAYVMPTLNALAAPSVLADVTVDGERRQAHWIVVANACRYGGRFRLAPQTHVERPGLVAVLVRASRRVELVAALLALAGGYIERCRHVEIIPCRRAEVRSPLPLPMQIDGDPAGTTPLTVTSDGEPVAFILPPKGTD
jgi:diacylglycerol kinase family enzyme